MATFKSEEAITVGSLTQILFVTCILLAIVFCILWLIKRYRPNLLTSPTSNIQIIETKTDLKLGTLAIISACGQQHLLVITKTGTSLHPLGTAHADHSHKENIN